MLNDDYLHVRCCAHIIKEMNNSNSNIHYAKKYLRSSPSKLIRFRKYVEHEKLDSRYICCDGCAYLVEFHPFDIKECS